ncbi:SH3 domain-containing protein [Priestia filamentosa]|uniref:SH3 domain-containing protein n=1 Tax=Priestia filamentosa TaxID=1402861 RepID=UPI003979957A
MTTLFNSQDLVNQNGELVISRKETHGKSNKASKKLNKEIEKENSVKENKTVKFSKKAIESELQKIDSRTERWEFRVKHQKGLAINLIKFRDIYEDFIANLNSNSFDLRKNPNSKNLYAFIKDNFSLHASRIKKLLKVMTFAVGITIVSGLWSATLDKAEACVEEYTYQVKRGDTLYHLAQVHGVGIENIQSVNELTSNNLKIGQKLIMPAHNQKTQAVIHPHEEQPTDEFEYEAQQQTVHVNQKVKARVDVAKLMIRTQATKHSVSLGHFVRNDEVTVLETNNGWARINYNGKRAFISSSFLDFSNKKPEDSVQKPVSPSVTERSYGKDMYVKAFPHLNVRSKSNIESKVIGEVLNNNPVHVISKLSNGWAKVSYNGGTGYVDARYLVVNKPVTETSTSTTTSTYEVTGEVVADEPQFIHFYSNGKTYRAEVTSTVVFEELQSLEGTKKLVNFKLKHREGQNPLLVSYAIK